MRSNMTTITIDTEYGEAVVLTDQGGCWITYPDGAATTRAALDVPPDAALADIARAARMALSRAGIVTRREAINDAKDIVVGHLEDYGDPGHTDGQLGALLNRAIPETYLDEAYAVGHGAIAGWRAAQRFAAAVRPALTP